jgi:hypothetical protein
MGVEPNHTIARNMARYKPFSTLCRATYGPFFSGGKGENHRVYIECQAFCSVVRIGSFHPLTRKRLLLPPFRWVPRGRHTRLRGREWGEPSRTTGQKLWSSVYYNPLTVKTDERKRPEQSLSGLLCVSAD